MLIHLTKSNQSAQLALLTVLTIVFWLPIFWKNKPIAIIGPQTFLYSTLFGWTATYVVLAKLLAFFCVVLQAYMLNEIIRRHALSKNPMFVGLVYVVLMSAQSEWLTMQPFLLSNFFILAGFSNLFKIHDRKEPYDSVFNASFWLALAALISPSLLPFGMIICWVFLFYPINKWREWVIAIIGFIFPFFVLFLWASLANRMDVFAEYALPVWDFSGFENLFNQSFSKRIFVVVVSGMGLLSAGFMRLRLKEKEISQRKKIIAMMLAAIWIIPVAIATSCLFFAFFIAEQLYRNERKWWVEIVFYGLLVVVFYARFF
ncbi:MAG: hypothetical protein LBU91_05765 [Bacteroidales bacterium]|jgi:hypothetical protein|nr:hypothetical protein [Bacteroidales bacterium]